MTYVQTLIDGIMIGGIYAIIGLGLSIAYGVMSVINWAHGEHLMLGMYIAYLCVTCLGLDPYLTIPITAVILGAFGYLQQTLFYNGILRRATSKAGEYILLFTAGLGVAMTGIVNMINSRTLAVKTVYTGKTIEAFKRFGLYISVPKAIAFVIAIVITLILYYIMQKTEIGRSIRAVAADRVTAQIMGIRSNFIFCLAFAISTALVGIAGSLMIPYYSVSPYVGNSFTFKAFMIVVLGGKGNVLGAIFGGVLIGLIEKIGGMIFGEAIAQILIFVLFIVILLVKPEGLLARKK